MEKVEVTLTHTSTKVHSERYDNKDANTPIKSLYIDKVAFSDGERRPDTIKVTVESA